MTSEEIKEMQDRANVKFDNVTPMCIIMISPSPVVDFARKAEKDRCALLAEVKRLQDGIGDMLTDKSKYDAENDRLRAENDRLQKELDAAVSIRTPMPAIPQKATEDTKIGNVTFQKGVTIWHCPTCGIFLTPTHKYCWKCGQSLNYPLKGV